MDLDVAEPPPLIGLLGGPTRRTKPRGGVRCRSPDLEPPKAGVPVWSVLWTKFGVSVWPVLWAARCRSLSFRDAGALTLAGDVDTEGLREPLESDLEDEDSKRD